MNAVMDRNLSRLLQTGHSIPADLQQDDTGPQVDAAAAGWARVRQIRGTQADPRMPRVQTPSPEPGQPPVNHALRQFLATGSSAPPSVRATGRTPQAPSEVPPVQDDGPWTGPGSAAAAVPVGLEQAMGQDR
jgi:hypothetical protein